MIVHREIIGDCHLYKADCLELLPHIQEDFDGVVSDPPYGIEDIVGGYGRSGFTIANDKTIDVCAKMAHMVTELYEHIWMMTFYSCRISPVFFKAMPSDHYFGEFIWDKKAPGMGKQIRYQHENVAIFQLGEPKPLNDTFSVLTHYRSDELSLHAHQKPTELMKRIVSAVPGGRILDPFMGSGSTGVACVKLGRPFIGIELDAGHFATACKRIETAYKEPDMFVEKAAPAVQEGLF